MAGIDKMYVKEFYEYERLKCWAIIYYPKFLSYFYTISLSYSDFKQRREDFIKDSIEHSKREYLKLGNFNNIEEAKANLHKHYLESANYDCTQNQLDYEVSYIIQNYKKSYSDWLSDYRFPITNTPLYIDRKLKWICPISFVRKYLEENCGIKTRWYHKLFFRGKKEFKYI